MRWLAAILLGCTSTSPLERAAEKDSGVDTTPAEVGYTLDIPRCGPGPWIVHSEAWSQGWGDNRAVVGQKVSTDLCPDLVVETDEQGRARFAMTRGQPYYVLTGIPGYPPFYYGAHDALLPKDDSFRSYYIRPRLKAPPYDPTKVTIAVIHYRAGTPPCDALDGMRVWVDGHPEAKTHYWTDPLEIPFDTPGTTDITIDNLPPDINVQVRAEKPGCKTEIYWAPNIAKFTRTHRTYETKVDIRLSGPIGDAGVDGG
jgi:hypothetical protein